MGVFAAWTHGSAGADCRRGVVRDKAISVEVNKALAETGRHVDLGLDGTRELSVEDWGVVPGGLRLERLGYWAVTLRVDSTRSTVIESRPWDKADAAPKRGIPKDALVDAEANDLADDLKAAVEDIPKLLRGVRARFDLSIRKQRNWAWPDWRERFLENELVATHTRRIIWSVPWPDGDRAKGIWQDGRLQDVAGKGLDRPVDDVRLSVWHPLLAGTSDAIEWADRLATLGIRRPFQQAWRPIYQLTPRKRDTGTYSNRFAGHIPHQPAFVAVLRQRGSDTYSRQSLMRGTPVASNLVDLPTCGIIAQFWAVGIGASNPSGHDYSGAAFDYVTTDRVVFFPQTGLDRPLSLDRIPAIAFSEVMRDIELAIGIASIDRDQFWTGHGTDAVHPANQLVGAKTYRQSFAAHGSAELVAMRHKALARFLPGLEIGPKTKLSPTEVDVSGTSGRSYAIHLGTAAVPMLLGRRHLCIVPSRAGGLTHPLYHSKAMRSLPKSCRNSFCWPMTAGLTFPIFSDRSDCTEALQDRGHRVATSW